MLNLGGYQSIDNLNSYNNDLRDIYPKSQGIVQDDYTIEWLDNTEFETPIDPWYNTTEGDISDVNASISSEAANFEVLGTEGTFTFVEDPPQASNWTSRRNPDHPSYPQWPEGGADQYAIDSGGFWARHQWVEGPRQTPSIQWISQVEMPVNMSDYTITSASVRGIVNATVNSNVDVNTIYGDTPDGDNDATPQGSDYDSISFYIRITDPDYNQLFQIASNKTYNLGLPTYTTMVDTLMTPQTENYLIFALTSALSYDYKNFSIIVGIDIFCEDNCWTDRDEFTSIRINHVSLNFTYEKKIDQFTSISWNQIGNKLTGANIDIENATLNFKYKIDKSWITSSPNSEFRVYINNRVHTETVKLSNANTTFQDIKIGGFDVTSLILKDVNISVSIQVYLADTFTLNQTIIISIDNASLLISFTENTVETETKIDILLNSVNKTLEKSIEVTMGNPVNITIIYKDQLNNFIQDASVHLVGLGAPKNLTENGSLEHYNITIYSSNLQIGNNFLTITASKRYYESISELINIKVIERNTELLLFLDEANKTLDKSIQMIYGNDGNITITYKDIEQVPYTHVDGATVELIGIGNPQNLTEDLSNEQYFIFIDTKDLGLGNSFLTVNAYKENYTTQSIRFKIEVLERNSYIDKIKLNGIETTSTEIPWNEILTISISYNDSFTNSFISGASVQLSGTGISENFTENSPINYSLNINTAVFALGINFLTISANKDNYTLSSRIITISVTERATKVDVYLNGTLSTLFALYNITFGEKLNITVFYKDLNTDSFINNANVRLIESGISTNLTESLIFNQYYITINSDDLGVGVHSITLYAKQDNYSVSLESVIISVSERETFIDEIFLNNIDKTTDRSITLTSGELLNITLKYKDSMTSNFISGALSTITGGGLSGGLSENFVFNHYSRVINSSNFNLGANFITISMKAENYSAAAVSLTIFVSERGTVASVFLNNSQLPDNYIIVEVWQSINITITYDDFITGNHLSNASVELLGIGYLNESLFFEQYTIIIDAVILGQGIDILNIIARKENYQSQPLQITVEIIERKTDLHLYMNGLNKTLDKFITLPIKSQINFTIDFFDSTGQFVSGALVQLLGEGLSLNLSENLIFNHYSITISTNQLDVGIRLLTIIAFKNNYQIQTIDIRLDIQRIKTNITTTSGESVINISPGETVSLKIILYDLDFGGTIKNASVSFSWSGGSGTLSDANNDGIYEAVISNIPDGSHTITISAYAGDDYSFERYEVFITVIRPAEDILLFWILLIVSSVATVSALTYLILYQKIFKYPKPVRKVRKYRKTLRKTKNPRVDVTAREKAFKGEYQNELAQTSKLLKGKPAEVPSKPEKILKGPIESSNE